MLRGETPEQKGLRACEAPNLVQTGRLRQGEGWASTAPVCGTLHWKSLREEMGLPSDSREVGSSARKPEGGKELTG